jgi:hypothetical protein
MGAVRISLSRTVKNSPKNLLTVANAVCYKIVAPHKAVRQKILKTMTSSVAPQVVQSWAFFFAL